MNGWTKIAAIAGVIAAIGATFGVAASWRYGRRTYMAEVDAETAGLSRLSW